MISSDIVKNELRWYKLDKVIVQLLKNILENHRFTAKKKGCIE